MISINHVTCTQTWPRPVFSIFTMLFVNKVHIKKWYHRFLIRRRDWLQPLLNPIIAHGIIMSVVASANSIRGGRIHGGSWCCSSCVVGRCQRTSPCHGCLFVWQRSRAERAACLVGPVRKDGWYPGVYGSAYHFRARLYSVRKGAEEEAASCRWRFSKAVASGAVLFKWAHGGKTKSAVYSGGYC